MKPSNPSSPASKSSIFSVKHWLGPLYPINSLNNPYQLPLAQLRKLGLIYSTYRVVISFFLLVTLYNVSFSFDTIFVNIPSKLHEVTLLCYCIISSLLFGFYYSIRQFERRQLGIGLVIDVIVLSILLFSNGAADLQITMLYMVVVAASFMLLLPYQSLVITLLAIIFVIYQQFFHAIVYSLSFDKMGDALLLCLSFIGVAFISWAVSQRLAQVEQIAATHAQELEKLNAINREVINKMSNGVLVVDKSSNVVISNEAAINFLGIGVKAAKLSDNSITNAQDTEKTLNYHLTTTLNRKHPALIDWFESASNLSQSQFVYQLPDGLYDTDRLRLNTTPLQDGSMLVILEDVRREQTYAQQLKLASLGQLTASIAHEIRNPLAAISQASQLLIEDANDITTQIKSYKEADVETSLAYEHLEQNVELYQIIFNQTKRVNRIIEDVLRLSRQAKPKQQKLELYSWLEEFVINHFSSHDIFIKADCNPCIYFDTSQLEQILINLINNGLRFSSQAHPHAFVELVIWCEKNNVILDVLDTGHGVDEDQISNLFNPFFTTDSQGTGLGLYLSQAFTEANHARLIYVAEHEKTCFRLLIPQAMPNA